MNLGTFQYVGPASHSAKSVNIWCMECILPKTQSTAFRHSSIASLNGPKFAMNKNEMHKGHSSLGKWGVFTAILCELSMTLLICNLEPIYEYVRMYRWEIDRPQQADSQQLVVFRKLRRMNQVVPGTKHKNVLGTENSEQTAHSDPQQQC